MSFSRPLLSLLRIGVQRNWNILWLFAYFNVQLLRMLKRDFDAVEVKFSVNWKMDLNSFEFAYLSNFNYCL